MPHKPFSTILFGMVAGLLAAALPSSVTGTAAQNKIKGIMAEQILEMNVRTQNGEDVGEIDDVVFDRQNGNMNRQWSENFRKGGPKHRPHGGNGRFSAYPGRWRAENGDLLMSAIIDATVISNRGENIGNIDNLVVNRRGQITYAITEVGGFLGIGDKKVAVPFNNLQHLGPYFAMYPGTEDQLESLPAFDKSQIVGQAQARGWSGKTAGGQQQKNPNQEEARQTSSGQNANQMNGQEQQ